MHKLLFLVMIVFASAVSPVQAHYNMLLPSAASGKKGEAVTLTYQWGHPFEHQLFNAPQPERVVVRGPDGKTAADLTKTLEKVSLPAGEGKTVTGYRFTFTPEQRGDYVFLLKVPPIFLEEDGEFVEDIVKVVFHVQAQKGWDQAAGGAFFEWIPLTRPYGLEPGMVFQAQMTNLTSKDNGFEGAMVEVEHYNPTPPKKLPPDEQITRVVRTDRNAVATGTLTEAGWWCLTGVRDGGKRQHGGKDYPVRQRSIFWVFVDEKPGR